MGSDHCPVRLTIDLDKIKPPLECCSNGMHEKTGVICKRGMWLENIAKIPKYDEEEHNLYKKVN